MALQALIFASFGIWMGTCAPQCGSSYPELAAGFMGTGALLFFVGLRASQGRPISSAIALLIEATYLATLGAGTASWRGYTSGLNPPFWVAMGLAAIAVPLLSPLGFPQRTRFEFEDRSGRPSWGSRSCLELAGTFWSSSQDPERADHGS